MEEIFTKNIVFCEIAPYVCTPIQRHRGMEQLVARWAHNPKVAGSSPAPATQKGHYRKLVAFFYV